MCVESLKQSSEGISTTSLIISALHLTFLTTLYLPCKMSIFFSFWKWNKVLEMPKYFILHGSKQLLAVSFVLRVLHRTGFSMWLYVRIILYHVDLRGRGLSILFAQPPFIGLAIVIPGAKATTCCPFSHTYPVAWSLAWPSYRCSKSHLRLQERC